MSRVEVEQKWTSSLFAGILFRVSGINSSAIFVCSPVFLSSRCAPETKKVEEKMDLHELILEFGKNFSKVLSGILTENKILENLFSELSRLIENGTISRVGEDLLTVLINYYLLENRKTFSEIFPPYPGNPRIPNEKPKEYPGEKEEVTEVADDNRGVEEVT